MKGSHGQILLRDTEGAPSSLLGKHYPGSSTPTGARLTAITTVIKTMILNNIQIWDLPRITQTVMHGPHLLHIQHILLHVQWRLYFLTNNFLLRSAHSNYMKTRNIWSSYEKCYPSFWTISHQILWKHRSCYYDCRHSCTFNLTVLMNTLRSSFHVYFSSDETKW